jgi:toxin YhaV
MQNNGWNLFQFQPFALGLQELTQEVSRLAQADPTGYKQHPKTKLLASVYQSMTVTVSANPADPVFCLGDTLGKSHGNWRRVKKGLPQRYRLFFMFASNPLAVVIYAWLNDEDTQRKEGRRTDVYQVFKRMLERGDVPSTIDELILGCIASQL